MFFPTALASAALRGEGVFSGDVSSLEDVAISFEFKLDEIELAEAGTQGCDDRSEDGDKRDTTERGWCGGDDSFD